MSDEFDLLILGGGPAGLSAARGYRDAGGRGRVAIVTDEHRMPYRRPPLTKELLRGELEETELPLEEERWLAEKGVDLIGGTAMALVPGDRAVTLAGGRTLRYGSCVLALGAEPTRLPVPGADHPGVRVVRTLDSVRELLARLRQAAGGAGAEAARALVIGSGFIGCELAASLRLRGHPVTLVSDEPAPNAKRLGEQAGAELAGWLRDAGVELLLGTPVDAIEAGEDGFTVAAGEARVRAEVVVMAGGVRPRSELARAAGIEVAEDGSVPVDAAMRTSSGSVLAAGDLARAFNAAAGRPLRVEHWGDALGQGQVAGATAAGADAAWDSVPGFWSTIGHRTLKYAAWGDGFDEVRFERHDGGGFTGWYGRDGVLVGVLAHQADEDYERGEELIRRGAPWPSS